MAVRKASLSVPVSPDRERAEPGDRQADDRGGHERRIAVALVVAVLVLGMGLRAVQASAHLPWDHHWDEINNIAVGEQMSADLDPDPGFYDYPALVFLAQAAVLVPARYLSSYDPVEEELLEVQTTGSAHVREPGLLLAIRWLSGVVPGLVTIAAAAAIAWSVARRWWVPAVSALLAALSAVDLRFGMFATPDALSGMAVTLAVLAAVRIVQDPSQRHYALTGAAIGFAGAAKYNAGLVVAALLVAHVIVHRRPMSEWRLLVAALLPCAAVFAAVNVGAVLHPVRFVQELGSEGLNYSDVNFDSEPSLLFNVRWLWLTFGLGLVLAAGALLGRAATVRRPVVVLWVFVGLYVAFVSAFPMHFARNLLPVSGSLAALAGIGAFVVVRRLRGLVGHVRARAVAVSTCAVVVLALPVASAAAATRDATEDPWTDVQEWVRGNVPPGATIAVEALTPFVDDARHEVVATSSLGRRRLGWYRQREVTVLIASDERYQPFLDDPDAEPAATETYRRLLARECVLYETTGAGRRLVVTALPPC